jgi:metal-responsive CopG/Arc/MetJ family transcriptional regulator
MVRATITLPPDLLDRLREIAAERDVPVGSVVREALEEKVGGSRPRPRSMGMGASGFSDTVRRAGEERPIPEAWH